MSYPNIALGILSSIEDYLAAKFVRQCPNFGGVVYHLLDALELATKGYRWADQIKKHVAEVYDLVPYIYEYSEAKKPGAVPRMRRRAKDLCTQIALEIMRERSALAAGQPPRTPVKEVLITEGTPCDGKPKHHTGTSSVSVVMGMAGLRDINCTILMEDGTRWKIGFKGFRPPSVESILEALESRPKGFSKVRQIGMD